MTTSVSRNKILKVQDYITTFSSKRIGSIYVLYIVRFEVGHDRMVVGFPTTCTISAYHH